MFKSKKKKDQKPLLDITGGEDMPYSSIVRKWSVAAGLCESWNANLGEAEPLDVVKCLQKLPVVKRKSYEFRWKGMYSFDCLSYTSDQTNAIV